MNDHPVRYLHLLIACTLLVITAATIGAEPSNYAANWPNWRGPGHRGVAATAAPLHWSKTQNVKWKAAIPGKGHSTPVIWGEKLFLTTAVPVESPNDPAVLTGARIVPHKFTVICFDRNTGKVLWERVATTQTPHEGFHDTYGSFASNAPITDGEHVYAYFGSRGLYVYDLEGNLAWKKDFGVKMQMRRGFGEGAAPVLHGNTIVIVFDQEAGSFILAIDKRNGKELWRKSRDEVSTWAQPLVVEHQGREQVIANGDNRVRSYDLKTGELIWECAGLGTNAIPVPVQFEDMVIVMTGHREPNLLTIRLGGKGDITGSEFVVWTNDRGNSYSASPVLQDGMLYVLTDRGMLSNFDARTGAKHYHQQRLPQPYQFKASPTAADGKLYLASEAGDVIVVNMGKTFEVLATNKMPDQTFIASPVVVGGDLYLRSQDTLYCIRESN